jgi:hypothetical protein
MARRTLAGLDVTLTNPQIGDRVATLKRIAARLSEEIDECESRRDLALLVTQLRQTLAELDELEVVEGVAAADMIAQRRAARRAGRAKGRSRGA